MHRLAGRFAVREVSEPPAAGCGILPLILDHELNIHGGPDNKRLSAREWIGQYLVVVFRRDKNPMKRGNDGAVRERDLPFFKGLNGYIVAS